MPKTDAGLELWASPNVYSNYWSNSSYFLDHFHKNSLCQFLVCNNKVIVKRK